MLLRPEPTWQRRHGAGLGWAGLGWAGLGWAGRGWLGGAGWVAGRVGRVSRRWPVCRHPDCRLTAPRSPRSLSLPLSRSGGREDSSGGRAGQGGLSEEARRRRALEEARVLQLVIA